MDTVLGLLGIIVFIAGIISLAVLATYAVVKLTPPPKPKADGKT